MEEVPKRKVKIFSNTYYGTHPYFFIYFLLLLYINLNIISCVFICITDMLIGFKRFDEGEKKN